MEYMKSIKDYSRTPLEENIAELLSAKLISSVCYEKIKNKDFLIQYVKPVHDFIISTNAYPMGAMKRI